MKDFDLAKQYCKEKSCEETSTIMRLMFEDKRLRLTAFCHEKSQKKFVRLFETFYAAEVGEGGEKMSADSLDTLVGLWLQQCAWGCLGTEKTDKGQACTNVLYLVVPTLSARRFLREEESFESSIGELFEFVCGDSKVFDVRHFEKMVRNVGSQGSPSIRQRKSGGNGSSAGGERGMRERKSAQPSHTPAESDSALAAPAPRNSSFRTTITLGLVFLLGVAGAAFQTGMLDQFLQ